MHKRQSSAIKRVRSVQRWILSSVFTLLFIVPASAQLDTVFWFVAPEVTAAHPNGSSPVRFNFATDDQPAEVTISQPAGVGELITLTIPANSALSQQLENQYFATANVTLSLADIENEPANLVLDKGFLIQSTAPITAYYEINATDNPDIFALKGSNGIGYEFFTPFQNIWDNANEGWPALNWTPAPRSAFDIVATEDNTSITITLPDNAAIVGHAAGTTFSITLNKGQTWSGEAVSGLASQRAGGTHIVASKPISVTVKDDSVYEQDPDDGYGFCLDIMGDQLIPVEILGKEYIVTKGFLVQAEYSLASHPPPLVSSEEADFAFIVATADNTLIFTDGNTVAIDTLNAGESLTIKVTEPSKFIRATEPIYVLHTSGNGCEIGEAVLPPVDNCTGSRKVFFTRAQQETLYLLVTVQTQFIDNFILNADATLVPPTAFDTVPGTNGKWQTTLLTFGPADNTIAVGEASIIQNTAGLFHFGFINGPTVKGGTRYGYFSSFNGVELSANSELCTTDSVTIDAGSNSISYDWSTGETTQLITVYEQGDYWVQVNQGGCVNTDTINVTLSEPLNVGINTNDSIICQGVTSTLDAGAGFTSYQWSNGAISQSIVVAQTGNYAVTVTNDLGCIDQDVLPVKVVDVPQAFVSIDDDVLCEGQTATIAAGAFNQYRWSSGETTNTISVPWLNPGLYSVTVTNEYGCEGDDAATVGFETLNAPTLFDDVFCPGEAYDIDAGSGYSSYLWSDGTNTQLLSVAAEGTYSVTVTNIDDCAATASMILSFSNFGANVGLAPTAVLCEGGNLTLSSNVFSTYTWSTGESTRSIDVTTGGDYWITVTDVSGCNGGDTVTIITQTAPEPTISDAGICEDSTFTLDAGPGFVNYIWSTGQTTQTIQVTQANNYSVVIIDENNCTGSGSMELTQFLPSATGLTDETVCENETLRLDANDQSAYLWSTGAVTPSIVPTEEGQYWIEYTDLNGCGATDTVEVTFINIKELPELIGQTICTDSVLTLDVGAGYSVYAWSTGGGSRSIQITDPGPYSVTVADANNCIQSKAYDIETGVAPTAVFLNDIVCDNDPNPVITVQLSGASPFTITYAIDDIVQIPINGHQGPTFEFTAPITDTYEIIRIVDGNNCPNNGPDAYVEITKDSVVADFDQNPIVPGCELVTVYFEDQSEGEPTSYQWSFNGTTSNEIHPSGQFDYESNAEVQLIATNANGCTDTITKTIDVQSFQDFFDDYFREINVFTPGNGDGYNDVFDIDPAGYFDECIDLIIYDRWGIKIYQSDEANPINTWDGDGMQGTAPSGTYYYIGDVQNVGFTGHLTLIRE